MTATAIDQILDTAATEAEAVEQLIAAGMARNDAEVVAAIAFGASDGDIVGEP